jgi:hypothetical protein
MDVLEPIYNLTLLFDMHFETTTKKKKKLLYNKLFKTMGK